MNYSLYGRNHPCRHFGIGPGVLNSTLPSSENVWASKTNIPTRLVSVPPHNNADKMIPSSSTCNIKIGTVKNANN